MKKSMLSILAMAIILDCFTPQTLRACFASPGDSPGTLEWVVRQSLRADSLLHDASRSSEPAEALTRLTDCYQIFDAVAMAGLYCTEVRIAAESGRRQCDVINYRLEKDLNSKIQRVVEARRQATLMREAAKSCLLAHRANPDAAGALFAPDALFRYDAQLAALDLSDGLASKDIHIFSQKAEHAIRLLHDVEHLTRSLYQCEAPSLAAERSIRYCENALGAPNWLEVERLTALALSELNKIKNAAPCR